MRLSYSETVWPTSPCFSLPNWVSPWATLLILLSDALFCEVNPIPVKYAMNVLGWEAGECRLPLVEPGDAHKEQIEQALQAAGLIKE